MRFLNLAIDRGVQRSADTFVGIAFERIPRPSRRGGALYALRKDAAVGCHHLVRDLDAAFCLNGRAAFERGSDIHKPGVVAIRVVTTSDCAEVEYCVAPTVRS